MLDEKILIEKEENIKRFWLSFTTWFKEELPGTKILRSHYECSDNWNGGSYHLNIDFEKEYNLYRFPAVLRNSRLPTEGSHP